MILMTGRYSMSKKVTFGLVLFLGALLFIALWTTPASAQYNLAGWWKARLTVDQGDFVTGEWYRIREEGKKGAYVYIFQETSNKGRGHLVFWDSLDQRYFTESYDLYLRNNVLVLYIPTFYDVDENPAASAIILRLNGSATVVTSMTGFYALYDLETSGSPDLFVRMGSVLLTPITPNRVPEEVKELIEF
jgi:hypothetical protein